jgi:hypothetical protein
VRLAVDLPRIPHPNATASVSPTALDQPIGANSSGKQWAKSVPPILNRLMADVDAAFV